jgi:hypothetical protein
VLSGTATEPALVSDNVLIALIDAAAMVLLLIAAYAIDRRAGSRRITQSIDSLRDRVSVRNPP